jgi:cysteine desulfurase / selenocysteine lyase
VIDETPSAIAAITAFRQNFRATSNWTYVDVAARGLLSVGTRDSIDAYLDHRMAIGGDKTWMFEQAEKARNGFAALVGAEPDEITLTKNVSDGVNTIANAISWDEGDNVVFCETLEHPANVFPWYNLSRQRRVQIKSVAATNGRIPLERIFETTDERTRLVAVSSVSFSPGFKFPIKALTDYCRPRGVLVLVDAAQSAGLLHTDVKALGVDAFAASTQKGLLALYGMGFLYVRRGLAETLEPAYLSRAGVRLESGHEAALGDASQYALAPAARRFDVGNFNFVGAVAVEHSMRELAAIGTAAIESYVCGLAAKLATGLAELGLPVFGGPENAERAHIVAVGHDLSDQHDSTSDEQMLSLHEHFEAAQIRHTIRRGMLRFSFHCYNNNDDVSRIIAVARQWMEKMGQRSAGSKAAYARP